MASPFLGPPCSQVAELSRLPLGLGGQHGAGMCVWGGCGCREGLGWWWGEDPYLAFAALPASLPVFVAQSDPSFPPVRMKTEGERLRNTDKHSLY